MDKLWFEYPTPEEYTDIERTYPFQALKDAQNSFAETMYAASQTIADSMDFHGALADMQVNEQILHLSNRIRRVSRAYVQVKFHIDKGIPDNQYFISPGPEGESIVYYPQFTNDEFYWRATQFFDYAELFYQRIFSTWDQIGHVLYIVYQIHKAEEQWEKERQNAQSGKVKQPKKISFYNACEALHRSERPLSKSLKKNIKNNPVYQQAQKYRNDLTHNFPLGSIHDKVIRYQGPSSTNPAQKVKTVSLTAGTYNNSQQIIENIVQSLNLLTETLNIVTNYQNGQDAE